MPHEVWGYAEDEFAESWQGRFLTRKECEGEALKLLDPEQEVWVCRGEPVTVEKAIDNRGIADDLIERLIEWMEEWAGENTGAEDEIFFIKKEDDAGARKSFELFIRAWARDHISTVGYWECVDSPILVRPGSGP